MFEGFINQMRDSTTITAFCKKQLRTQGELIEHLADISEFIRTYSSGKTGGRPSLKKFNINLSLRLPFSCRG